MHAHSNALNIYSMLRAFILCFSAFVMHPSFVRRSANDDDNADRFRRCRNYRCIFICSSSAVCWSWNRSLSSVVENPVKRKVVLAASLRRLRLCIFLRELSTLSSRIFISFFFLAFKLILFTLHWTTITFSFSREQSWLQDDLLACVRQSSRCVCECVCQK